MPYYYNFKASPRLPLGLSQIFKFECVTLRVLECCNDSSIGCLFNNGSMNFNLSLPSFNGFFLFGELQNASPSDKHETADSVQTLKFNYGWDLRIPQP